MFNPKTFLDSLSLTWTTKYPNHQDRIDRGALLALSGKVAPRGLDTWRIVGSKKPDGSTPEYTVTVTCGYPSCTCPDYTEKNHRCKHIWACAFLTRLAEEIERQLPKPDPRQRKKLSKSLGEHCTKLYTQNTENVRGSK